MFRSAEDQAAGTGLPPARVLPTTTYPAGPAAAWATLVPAAVSGPVPDAGVQYRPVAEVRITGWYGARVPAWPTASQPEPPATTLTRPPFRHGTGSRTAPGAHWPPGAASHSAGAPPAAPAATCVRPAVASAPIVTSGVAAAARTGCPTCWRCPALVSSRCGVPAAPAPGRLFPATTTLPSGPAVRPASPLPGSAVCRQPRPPALKNAIWPECVVAASAKPSLLPVTAMTRIEVRRSGNSRPANRHCVPCSDRYVTASWRPAPAWPGRTATNVLPAAARPARAPVAPCVAGSVTGAQFRPPSVLRHTAARHDHAAAGRDPAQRRRVPAPGGGPGPVPALPGPSVRGGPDRGPWLGAGVPADRDEPGAGAGQGENRVPGRRRHRRRGLPDLAVR